MWVNVIKVIMNLICFITTEIILYHTKIRGKGEYIYIFNRLSEFLNLFQVSLNGVI